MAGKRKTTMAKLNRERKLRERRVEKQVKKNLRKKAAAEHSAQPANTPFTEEGSGGSSAG